MKVIPVDCNYVGSEFACCYLLVQEITGIKRGLFIECNTNYAIPFLMKAAAKEGIVPEHVDGLVITHVHLDHAGGTGVFLKEFPNAKVYAHPRAARHIIDPSKLIASATQVYGEAFIQKMYGTIIPAPSDKVIVLEDGDPVIWGNVTLQTKHTRGHANHHLCVVAPATQSAVVPVTQSTVAPATQESEATVFTGDSFGVSYPQVVRKRGLVMTVSTTPTDFDGEAALQTVEWIENLKMRAAVTHFGFIEVADISRAAKMLKDQIRFSTDMVNRIMREAGTGHLMAEAEIKEYIQDWTIQYYANQNIHFDTEDLKILNFDFSINAQGLLAAAMKTMRELKA